MAFQATCPESTTIVGGSSSISTPKPNPMDSTCYLTIFPLRFLHHVCRAAGWGTGSDGLCSSPCCTMVLCLVAMAPGQGQEATCGLRRVNCAVTRTPATTSTTWWWVLLLLHLPVSLSNLHLIATSWVLLDVKVSCVTVLAQVQVFMCGFALIKQYKFMFWLHLAHIFPWPKYIT